MVLPRPPTGFDKEAPPPYQNVIKELNRKRVLLEGSLNTARKVAADWESKYYAEVERSVQFQEQLHRLRDQFHVVSRVPGNNTNVDALFQLPLSPSNKSWSRHSLLMGDANSTVTWPTTFGYNGASKYKQVTASSDSKNWSLDDDHPPGDREPAFVENVNFIKAKRHDDKLRSEAYNTLDKMLTEKVLNDEMQPQANPSTARPEEFEGKPDREIVLDEQARARASATSYDTTKALVQSSERLLRKADDVLSKKRRRDHPQASVTSDDSSSSGEDEEAAADGVRSKKAKTRDDKLRIDALQTLDRMLLEEARKLESQSRNDTPITPTEEFEGEPDRQIRMDEEDTPTLCDTTTALIQNSKRLIRKANSLLIRAKLPPPCDL
mmetsp:Transcript_10714/g.19559  ORF Transcript_10714/g.19559 Transcript_10714/m.19559 type:complete len:380 (-) Transcript_10714:399-1538(-)